jgi:hypothetical protein
MIDYNVIHSGGRDGDVDVSQTYTTANEALAAADRLPEGSNVRLRWDGETYSLHKARVMLSGVSFKGA